MLVMKMLLIIPILFLFTFFFTFTCYTVVVVVFFVFFYFFFIDSFLSSILVVSTLFSLTLRMYWAEGKKQKKKKKTPATKQQKRKTTTKVEHMIVKNCKQKQSGNYCLFVCFLYEVYAFHEASNCSLVETRTKLWTPGRMTPKYINRNLQR